MVTKRLRQSDQHLLAARLIDQQSMLAHPRLSSAVGQYLDGFLQGKLPVLGDRVANPQHTVQQHANGFIMVRSSARCRKMSACLPQTDAARDKSVVSPSKESPRHCRTQQRSRSASNRQEKAGDAIRIISGLSRHSVPRLIMQSSALPFNTRPAKMPVAEHQQQHVGVADHHDMMVVIMPTHLMDRPQTLRRHRGHQQANRKFGTMIDQLVERPGRGSVEMGAQGRISIRSP
ncbi:MAG: hypothetical protein JJU07_07415 [Natronohydrobacter sp.]|nr:hypothetical protein [Natronohydrobacter sp.]